MERNFDEIFLFLKDLSLKEIPSRLIIIYALILLKVLQIIAIFLSLFFKTI